jgi:hypothetical protein
MKPYLISFLLLLLSVNSFGQRSSVDIAGYYGISNKLGFDFVYNKNISLGFGFAAHMGKGAVGRDYSKTMGPNAYPNEIYEVVEVNNVAFYAIIGKSIKDKIFLAGHIGYCSRMKYFNAYDPTQILSPNGYYYTSTELSGVPLIGGSIIINTGKFCPYIGYDNINSLKIGVTLHLRY